MFVNGTFGNLLGGIDELDKPKQYYKHAQNWRNRLIQGDSLLVMTSLLEREGMAGKVQMSSGADVGSPLTPLASRSTLLRHG
jgi:adenine-specific DNA-methyltransferase